MVLSRLEPEPVPAAPPPAAGFRSETVRVAPPEASGACDQHPWRVFVSEYRRVACSMASAASLAAQPIRPLGPPGARIEQADRACAAAWRRNGNPPRLPLSGGRCTPRRLSAAGPISLRLDWRNVVSRPQHTCAWRRQRQPPVRCIETRRTVKFTLGLAPPRALEIGGASGPAPRLGSVAEWRYTRFVLPQVARKPMELPVPSATFFGRDSSLDEQELPKPRWTPRRTWFLVPKPVRAGILVLPLLGAGGLFLPRIETTLRQVHWERPALVDRWTQRIESRLRARAAIILDDNFTSGLAGWDGGPGGLSDWVYDQAGLVRPGKLAILKTSSSLSNYRFELLGQIRKKSLSWAFRATDQDNYYAMKIVITRPGPLPRTALVRYAVVRGIPAGRVQMMLPLTVRNDTIYRVVTRVYQDGFITSVNGQVVDSFIDPRHPAGGVGLFGEPGEEARIVRVRVADRDDLIGKICAYFLRLPADSWSGLVGRAP